MATIVYFDSEVSAGGRDGTTHATAYNDSDFRTYNFSKGTDYEFRFANGSAFTLGPTIKNVAESAGHLKFTNYDRGDGARTLPTFTCMTEYSGAPTWTEIDATDALAGTYTAAPGSKLWHCAGITGFIGAYLDDAGALVWGKQCDVSNVSGSGADAPDEQGAWCNNAAGAVAGLMIYSDTDPNTYYSQGSRAIMDGVESIIADWKFTRPIGGLEMENLRFERGGSSIMVLNATASTLVADVHLHDLEFSGVERCFSISGSGSMSDGAGFAGLVIERCVADNLGAQFVATPNQGVALNDSEIRYNIVKGVNRKISSGSAYLSNCYSTNGTGVIVHHNWLHDTQFGNYWKADGYPIYSERNSRDIEWCYNLVTSCRRAVAINGTGRHSIHHNWLFAGAESTTSDYAINNVDYLNASHDLSAHLYQNVAIGFAAFLTASTDFVTYPDNRLRVYRNIASGLTTNSNCNPIRTRATTTETHINVRQNNFFGFWATGSITWKEYDGGTTTLTHTQADTSTTDNTALLAGWPEPDPDSTRNHALKLPAGITAAGATRGTTQINEPCLAPV